MMYRDYKVEVFGKIHHFSSTKSESPSLVFLVNSFLRTLTDPHAAGLSLLSVTNRRSKQPLELDAPFDKVPSHIQLIFYSKAATDSMCNGAVLDRVMSFVPTAHYLRCIYNLMRTCKGAYNHLIRDAYWTDERVVFKSPFVGPCDDDWIAYKEAYGLPLMNLHRIRHIFNSTSRMKLYYGCLEEGSGGCIAIATTTDRAVFKLVNDQILPRSAKHPPCLAAYEPLSDEGSLVKVESCCVCVEDLTAQEDFRLRRVGDGRLGFYCWEHDTSASQLLRLHCQRLFRRLSALVFVVSVDEPNLPRLLTELFASYFTEWRRTCLQSSSSQVSAKVFSSLPVLVLLEVGSCTGAELLKMRCTVTDIVRPLAGKHAFKVQPLRRGCAGLEQGAAAGFNFLARVLGRNAFL